ncbi:NAD(P)-dependent oxidoreductase [Planosporangium flavigriseum]|uniref:3-hydroxyisobutyrate dehydrogenase n=1 Tax=Planosporangium flavigriseum TaxID=373681 RepID=A0A8J3LQ26_9ACTN|nr:NAD(P)-dependent oxidoreductase [Planosporangium flavigriseum]NJC65061.1 NAD(P)-dependent oxidoreductase [Planosporangium flavigriseum]GIG71676.1 3-hydroxyisobutyrate dehydrogenase [Planosporangium flavigriseum]
MTIAVLGTGIMGSAMARNWLKAGETVRVWNRTRAKAEPLAEAGAQVADDPATAVDGADVIVTMLFDADAVAATMEAASDRLRPGALWLQMSTVGLEGADRLAELALSYELRYVDAPVVGTKEPAEQGKLTVLASGPDEVRDSVVQLLRPIAAKALWLGPAGTGSRLKLVVNTWVLTATEGVANAFALADALGLDGAAFLEVIGGGPLDLKYAHVKGALMMRREFPPSFPVNGARKDANLILAAGRSAGVDLAAVEAARSHLDTVAQRSHRDEDMAAMYLAARRAL